MKEKAFGRSLEGCAPGSVCGPASDHSCGDRPSHCERLLATRTLHVPLEHGSR